MAGARDPGVWPYPIDSAGELSYTDPYRFLRQGEKIAAPDSVGILLVYIRYPGDPETPSWWEPQKRIIAERGYEVIVEMVAAGKKEMTPLDKLLRGPALQAAGSGPEPEYEASESETADNEIVDAEYVFCVALRPGFILKNRIAGIELSQELWNPVWVILDISGISDINGDGEMKIMTRSDVLPGDGTILELYQLSGGEDG